MKSPRSEAEGSRFAKEIGRKEGRLLVSRRSGHPRISSIGAIGIIGWTVTLPMLAGIALGRWIDGIAGGHWSFTVMLMIGGLFLGCATAWGWVRRRLDLGKETRKDSAMEVEGGAKGEGGSHDPGEAP
ncbi:MAG TPA: AtpZ/AtpI family protein [Rectinemataceae bacterium]|nr:AtpZ/AtpI family protein [Rectinemataceae bacterium]